MRLQYRKIVGHGHVADDESDKAKLWGKMFFKFRMAIMLFLLLQWNLELHYILKPYQIKLANLFVWSFFVIESLRLLQLVKNKKQYIIRNWPIPVILICGIQLFVRPDLFALYLTEGARLILIAWLFIPWFEICLDSLSDNKLMTTIFTAIFIIITAGIIISGFDPAIDNAWDGIWWAWVTVTTVGYGDVVPISVMGRIFSFWIILLGLVLFAAFTANFSAIFIKHRLSHNLATILKEEKEIMLLTHMVERVDVHLEKLDKRLSRIEEANGLDPIEDE